MQTEQQSELLPDRYQIAAMARASRLKGDALVQMVRMFFRYEPETGHLFWNLQIKHCPTVVGQIAGKKYPCNGKLYICIKFQGRNYMAHRLAWAWTHGRDCEMVIDHVNGNGMDNRLSNLRECTMRQNQQNQKRNKRNTTGFKGVSLHQQTGKYTATIRADGKSRHLGLFLTPEIAHDAYKKAADEYHGEFANYGATHG